MGGGGSKPVYERVWKENVCEGHLRVYNSTGLVITQLTGGTNFPKTITPTERKPKDEDSCDIYHNAVSYIFKKKKITYQIGGKKRSFNFSNREGKLCVDWTQLDESKAYVLTPSQTKIKEHGKLTNWSIIFKDVDSSNYLIKIEKGRKFYAKHEVAIINDTPLEWKGSMNDATDMECDYPKTLTKKGVHYVPITFKIEESTDREKIKGKIEFKAQHDNRNFEFTMDVFTEVTSHDELNYSIEMKPTQFADFLEITPIGLVKLTENVKTQVCVKPKSISKKGTLFILNKTPYLWTLKGTPTSILMEDWDKAFPTEIEPETHAQIKIQFTENFFNVDPNRMGKAIYAIEELENELRIEADADTGKTLAMTFKWKKSPSHFKMNGGSGNLLNISFDEHMEYKCVDNRLVTKTSD